MNTLHKTYSLLSSFSLVNRMVSLACLISLLGTRLSVADTTLEVDSTRNWIGWMNWYNNNGGSQGDYIGGQAWGTTDLVAYFIGTNSVTLLPNTNVWNTADPFWVNSSTTPARGAKWMEANFYVDAGTAYGGQSVTFEGNVLTNSLAAPYSAVAFIKIFAPGYFFAGMITEPLVEGSPFSVGCYVQAGYIVQYGFMLTGPDANPATAAALGKVVVAVINDDPLIGTLTNAVVVEGQTAVFALTAKGTGPLSHQWTQPIDWFDPGLITDGGRFSGANTNRLEIQSVSTADAGTYTLTVANSRGSAVASAYLGVLQRAQLKTNLLIDPGFELGVMIFAPEAGWFPFNGAAKCSTNDYYFLSDTQVSVAEGTNCGHLYSNGPGSYSGFYQDRPALPGQVYTGGGWLMTPTDDPLGRNNVCYLEVQFRDTANVPLVEYRSATLNSNSPASTWLNFVPTNKYAGNLATFLGTSSCMVAPPGTAKVRYQVTYHAAPTNDFGGSVYVDSLSLTLREAPATVSYAGGNVTLSFPTSYGVTYQVYCKTNLTDPVWLPLGSAISGDGNLKTAVDPAVLGQRFYTVNTQ